MLSMDRNRAVQKNMKSTVAGTSGAMRLMKSAINGNVATATGKSTQQSGTNNGITGTTFGRTIAHATGHTSIVAGMNEADTVDTVFLKHASAPVLAVVIGFAFIAPPSWS
jgi:hypothetical protein